jgi:hypothetical protein
MNVSIHGIKGWFQKFSLRKLSLAWYRYFRIFFGILFLLILGVGSYIWYQSLYNYKWSEDEKKTYMEITVKETNLKYKELEKLLVSLKERERQHQEKSPITRNLFTGEPVINQ